MLNALATEITALLLSKYSIGPRNPPSPFLVVQHIVQNSKDPPIEPFRFALYVLRITFYSLRLYPIHNRMRAGFLGIVIPLLRNRTVSSSPQIWSMTNETCPYIRSAWTMQVVSTHEGRFFGDSHTSVEK